MGEQGESVTQLAVDLAVAWESCRKVTERHFPGALERREPDSEGYWLHLTGGKITELVHMPEGSSPRKVSVTRLPTPSGLYAYTTGGVGREGAIVSSRIGFFASLSPWSPNPLSLSL